MLVAPAAWRATPTPTQHATARRSVPGKGKISKLEDIRLTGRVWLGSCTHANENAVSSNPEQANPCPGTKCTKTDNPATQCGTIHRSHTHHCDCVLLERGGRCHPAPEFHGKPAARLQRATQN
eukprot:3225346-Rhodomonas_salina.1